MTLSDVFKSLFEMGPLNLLLSFAEPFFSAFLIYYFMYRLLPNRLNVYSLLALSLVYALWFNLSDSGLLGTSYHLWMTIFINAFTLSIIIFLYKGKLPRKIMVWYFFEVLRGLCQSVAYVPVMLHQSQLGLRGSWLETVSSVEANDTLNLLYVLITFALFLSFGALSYKIWQRILMRKFHPYHLLFIILPMGQKYALALVMHPSMGDLILGIMINFIGDVGRIYQILALSGIFACFVAGAAVFYYILSHDKKAVIDLELQEAKHKMELEQSRYSDIIQQNEEMSKICHDFNNQFSTILFLIRSGEDSAAEELIDDLSKRIAITTG